MVLGLENASGYDSVAVWRYVDFLYLMAHGRPYPERKLKHDFAGIGVWNLSSRLLDLMDVRWLVAEAAPLVPAPDGGPRWVERFRPEEGQGAPAAKYEMAWNARLRVFENRTVLPRAFVVHRVEVLDNDARLAARLLAPDFDPGRVALLEAPLASAATGGAQIASARPGESAPPGTPARVVERTRHRLVVEVEVAEPGLLVLGEVHYPGWTATVDGRAAPLVRTNWTFRGVPLGVGRHRVELDYRSRPTELGLALSVAGLVAIALMALGGRRRSAR